MPTPLTDRYRRSTNAHGGNSSFRYVSYFGSCLKFDYWILFGKRDSVLRFATRSSFSGKSRYNSYVVIAVPVSVMITLMLTIFCLRRGSKCRRAGPFPPLVEGGSNCFLSVLLERRDINSNPILCEEATTSIAELYCCYRLIGHKVLPSRTCAFHQRQVVIHDASI